MLPVASSRFGSGTRPRATPAARLAEEVVELGNLASKFLAQDDPDEEPPSLPKSA